MGIDGGCSFISKIPQSGSEYKKIRDFLNKHKKSFYVVLKVEAADDQAGEPTMIEIDTFDDNEVFTIDRVPIASVV